LLKCLAYIVVYDWIKGEPKQRPKTLLLSGLHVQDTETWQPTIIDIKDLTDSHKTLGTHQNPTRDPTYQSKMLSQKEKKMTTFFWHSKLPKYKVHLAYHSMHTKILQFPFGVTMMSYDMAYNVSKRTMRAVIGATNVNWSLPHTLAFARTNSWDSDCATTTVYKALSTASKSSNTYNNKTRTEECTR
jgi:hypothetical protein